MQIVSDCGGLPGTTVSWVPDPKVSCQPEPEETLWYAQQQKPDRIGQKGRAQNKELAITVWIKPVSLSI